jgi:F0F1-type ATP synthase assembly protein I
VKSRERPLGRAASAKRRGVARRGPLGCAPLSVRWRGVAALIPVGIGIGYFVDGRLESSPIGLVIGAVLGFAAFVRRLVSMRSLVESAPPKEGAPDSERSDPS